MLPVLYMVRRTWAVLLIFHSLLVSIRGDCGPPPVIEHTQPVAETSGVPGATVTYKCDRSTGYYEIPNEARTITCQDDGTWSSVSTFCTRACGVPDRLQYAVPRDSDLEKDIFEPGTIVRYDCRDGYRRAPQTINSITCLNNYTWSVPSVFCERRTCGNPGDIENGDFEATDGFLFGSRVTYKCNTGYQFLSRRAYRDCQADATWSNVVPQCDAVICEPPDSPAEGTYNPMKEEYTYLDAVTFTCNKGLHIDGESTASCTSDGTWSTAPPNCKAVDCQDPGQVEHARRAFGFVGPYTLNSNVGYQCEGNFVIRGSSSITCNINSQWEPGIPKCLIPCKDPKFENSKIIMGSKHVYVQDDVVSFECETAFVLNGSPVITCSSQGQWVPSPPKCDATCQFPHIANARPKEGPTKVYVHNDVLVIECEEDFVLSGPGSITCSSQGQWGPHLPECKSKEVEPSGGLSSGGIAAIIIVCIVVVVGAILMWCYFSKQKTGEYVCENKNNKIEQELINSNNTGRKPKSDTPDVHYTACNDA